MPPLEGSGGQQTAGCGHQTPAQKGVAPFGASLQQEESEVHEDNMLPKPSETDQTYDELLELMLIDPERICLPGNLVSTWTSKSASYRPADVPPALFDATITTAPPEVKQLTVSFPEAGGDMIIDDKSGLDPGSDNNGAVTLEVSGEWDEDSGFCISITRKAQMKCDEPDAQEDANLRSCLAPCSFDQKFAASFIPSAAGKRSSTASKQRKATHRDLSLFDWPCEIKKPVGPSFSAWNEENAAKAFEATSIEDAVDEISSIWGTTGCQLYLPLVQRPAPLVPIHQFVSEMEKSNQNEKTRFRMGPVLNVAGKILKNLETTETAIKQKTDNNLNMLSKFDHDEIYLLARMKGNMELIMAEIVNKSRLLEQLEFLAQQVAHLQRNTSGL